MKKIFPLLWRYVFVQYGKTLALSLFGFLVILLSTRLEEAARLASTGASVGSIVLFIVYQIPYVLQIALPISTLIASLYLFQRLSLNNELTAVRASGIGLFQLITPIAILSIFLALFSFQVVFDASVRAHLAAKELEYNMRQMHPLAALHNTRLLEQHGISLEMEGSLLSDKHASNMIMAVKNESQNSCTVVVIKKVASINNQLSGHLFSLISSRPTTENGVFNELLIENAKESQTPLQGLTFVANKKKEWKAGNDLLQLPLLLAKKAKVQEKIEAKKADGKRAKRSQKQLNHIYSELARRISSSLAIISFTLLGIAYGCAVGRQQSKKRFIPVILLAALFLITFLAAKGIPEKAATASVLYFVPHIIIILVSIARLQRLQRGIEG